MHTLLRALDDGGNNNFDNLLLIKRLVDQIFDVLRDLFGYLKAATVDTFNRYGLKVRKLPQQTLNLIVIPVPVDNGLYAIYRENKLVATGTKQEMDEIAERLAKMTDEDGAKYLDELYKTTYRKKRLKEMDGWTDINGDGNKYSIHEINSFIDLELKFETIFRPSVKSEAGDVIATTGKYAGKSFDPLGLPAEAKAIEHFNRKPIRTYNDFVKSINTHIDKLSKNPPLDYVVIDLRNFSKLNDKSARNKIEQFIKQNYQQLKENGKIIILN